MALRILNIEIDADDADALTEAMGEVEPLGRWESSLSNGNLLASILLRAEDVEPTMDAIEQSFGSHDAFRIVLVNVEATLPRVEEIESSDSDDQPQKNGNSLMPRISREEIHSDLSEACNVNTLYIAMVVLSTIVAAVGLLRDNTAVVIGAMVIAPLLGPNAALALATTLADRGLAWKAVKANVVGLCIAILSAILLGFFVPLTDPGGEIMSRTTAHLTDFVLALAAGAAGTLAFTSAVPSGLVGVMVAAALLPPAVVSGLLLANGRWEHAAGAALLLTLNIVCFNLAGVATFLVAGIRPRTWWEAERAKVATRSALAVWVTILAGLTGLVIYLFR